MNDEKPTIDAYRGRGDIADKNLLGAFAEYLETEAYDDLVVIDSITSLVRATRHELSWGELVMFLEGLQRVNKQRNGLIYGLLDDKTLETEKYQDISSIFDGVFRFEWGEQDNERQHLMYVESFRGMMSKLSSQQRDKFETEVRGRLRDKQRRKNKVE